MKRFITSCLFAFVGTLWATTGHAFVVSIDKFSIDRNGATLFTDTFDGGPGTEPPIAPNFLIGGGPASYNVFGTIPSGAESGGLLLLDTANGTVSANALDQARIEVRARLLTDISADLNLGLKSDDTLSLTGIFSATTPSGVLNPQYAIRFADSPGAGIGSDQILQLQVTFGTETGEAQIRYILQDFVANTITVLGSATFAPGGADEILLNISRPDAASNDFYGRFAYVTGGVVGSYTTFALPGQMFNGENFVRADFNISDGFVPEPATLALLGLGLIALGFSRRKKA